MAILSLTACQKALVETGEDSGPQGGVQILLGAEDRNAEMTKATSDSDLPDVADFTVEIFKTEDNKRLYRDSYANTAGTTIYLNTGDYKLSAWHGDSLGAGFNAAYYAALEPFTVHQQVTTEINAVAKLANVKVAVVYSANVGGEYESYYSVVRSRENSAYELQFEMEETRAGYLPSGNLTFEFWAEVDGTWNYYTYDAGYFAPNDFVTFNVDTERGEGTVSLNITIDRDTELIEMNIDVPSSTLPKDAPKITFTGFDSDNIAEAPEGGPVDTEELRADIVAHGSIAHLYLNLDSDYLSAARILSEVDLANVDDQTAELLEEQGFKWSPAAERVLCYVDFHGFLTKLCDETYDEANPLKAQISLTVEDSLGQSTSSETYTITNAAPKPVFTYTVNDWDIWATKLTNQSVDCTVGDPAAISLQYKASNQTQWTSAEEGTVSGTTISFGTIAGLTGGTEYTFRAIYDGDEANAVEVTVTTEEEAQVGDSGLETWDNSFTHSYTSGLLGLTKNTAYYWQPYVSDAEDPWWAVNGEESMVSSVGTYTSNIWHAIFCCAGPSTDTPSEESSYSAHLITVNTGKSTSASSTNGGTTHTGELYIGTPGTDGAHGTDGHAFTSRPSGISFDYKYIPYGSETFSFEAELYADENAETLIASFSTTEGAASDEWTTYTADLDYEITDMQAAWIYISFKASTAASPSVSESAGVSVEYDGEELTAHAGSSLRIDNIQLIYE